jgi:mannose-6-phosphate isomerase-like protein (cupin superfamily)
MAAGLTGPGEGTRYVARGSVMAFKALAASTDGDFSLMERTLPPHGRTPPAHRHGNCSEGFFVLDGAVSFQLDGEQLVGAAGDFVLVPRGVGHTFGNDTDRPARLLVLHAPAMDGYFARLHELWAGEQPPTPEQERALQAEFGMSPA